MRPLILNGACSWRLNDEFYSISNSASNPVTAIGGPVLSGALIGAAMAAEPEDPYGHPYQMINGFAVRAEVKDHGTQNRIENCPPPGAYAMVVDDVMTTGNSLRRACDHLMLEDVNIASISVILDNDEKGVAERLTMEYGCPVYSLFKASDFD